MKSKAKPRVVVLGGGFGGLSCALGLPAADFDVTVIDQKPHFEFLPAIHELVSGRKTPTSLRLSLKSVLESRGHRFKRALITSIDADGHRVFCATRELEYDYLVVALGAADTDFGIPGVRKHTLGFKSVEQCAAIGKAIKAASRRSKPTPVTVIGGGFEGIEAIGEILRGCPADRLQLSVVDAAPRLLSSAPAAVSRHLENRCAEYGVTMRLGQPVARVMPKTVELADGTRFRSQITIWTGGSQTQPVIEASGLLASSGESSSQSIRGQKWVPTTKTLIHPNHSNIFCIGDTANLEPTIAKQAYHAMDMGSHCASNLVRMANGRRARVFKPSTKPQLVAFGDIDTVLLTNTTCLASPTLGLLKEAIYQGVMAQFDQRRPGPRIQGILGRLNLSRGAYRWPAIALSELRRLPEIKRLS